MAILFKQGKIKNLAFGKKSLSGRNNSGKITIYHRGGGHKKAYRLVDYKKSLWNIFGIVNRVEYDPNRTSFISLIIYANGIMSYSISVEHLKIGDSVISSSSTLIKNGNTLSGCNVPIGTKVCCVEKTFLKGAQYARAAGAYATLVSKFKKIIILKLKSGSFLRVKSINLMTIGVISNFQFIFRVFKKAGYYRLKGWRPVVRGVAMNPIDHPHGGGQGKTSGGRPSVTPWGVITKGKPTVSKKN